MATSLNTLRNLVEEDDTFVLCRCLDCGRRLGRYAFSRLLLDPADPSWLPVLTEETKPSAGLWWASRPGTGLAVEGKDRELRGRLYVRLRCKCGPRNQKFSLSTLRDFPIVMERGERVVYL